MFSQLLILIVLVGWMEPQNYQGMEVKVAQACKGARYQNLWYINEKKSLINYVIDLYSYWDVLHLAEEKVPRLFEEATMKYW